MARKRIFDRLPDIWRRLDLTYDETGAQVPGFLERFCDVLDAGFDRSHDKAHELLVMRSVDGLPDRYLALLAPIVGHTWRSDKGPDWNRRKIRSAIRRWSYKGTLQCIGDLVDENGGGPWSVVDMASKLLTLGIQGELGQDNAYFEGADYYATGAFVLTVSDQVDVEGLRADLAEVLAAGEVWYLRVRKASVCVSETVWRSKRTSRIFSTNIDEFAIGVGTLGDTLWLGGDPSQRPSMRRGWMRGMAVSGGSLCMDSPFSMDRTDITMDMGSPTNPLSETMAIQQLKAKIT